MIDGDLLRYNIKDKKIVVFDFEGDLNLIYSTPFQLSFSIYEGTILKKPYDYYIKWPDLYISDFVKNYAHYNPKRMEKEGVNPHEVFTEFAKYIYNESYLIVGANILSFDIPLLYNCFKRLGLRHDWSFLNRVYDNNALVKGMKLDAKIDRENLLAYQLSMNSIKQKGLFSSVGRVAKEFGIEFDDKKAHDGSYDVDIISKTFFELIKKIEI